MGPLADDIFAQGTAPAFALELEIEGRAQSGSARGRGEKYEPQFHLFFRDFSDSFVSPALLEEDRSYTLQVAIDGTAKLTRAMTDIFRQSGLPAGGDVALVIVPLA